MHRQLTVQCPSRSRSQRRFIRCGLSRVPSFKSTYLELVGGFTVHRNRCDNFLKVRAYHTGNEGVAVVDEVVRRQKLRQTCAETWKEAALYSIGT